MKKSRKKFLVVSLILLSCIGSFVYAYFNGLPWKEKQVANELQQYLEERYDESFVLNSTFFDEEERVYGAIFSPAKDQSMAFNARKESEDAIMDDYPEGVWQREFQEDVEPAVRKNFPKLKDWYVGTAYGQSGELVEGPTIPTYQEAGAFMWVEVSKAGVFNDSEQQWEQIYQLVHEVHKLTSTAEVSFSFDEKKGANEEAEVYISCMPAEVIPVKTVQDAKNACEVTRFD
ncbi:hypothetical protein [Bacillus sp. FJAT-42315]|uniref:hypothetical protein n=1 Tax=Bacillus sp. FJAT-42315 TaxID=2014077 RepID=UPI000C2482EB|nr:hypothetical protein [Bacillus sp. FJAT-42315]